MGPGGSGKTTVITNIIQAYSELSFCFCAFTNKAVTVFRNMLAKWNIKNKVKDTVYVTTIHKLLELEPKYGIDHDDLSFEFDEKRVLSVLSYDVIFIDECSTISSELYSFITKTQQICKDTRGKSPKLVFIGDFWQLPPVGETRSSVFQFATADKWPITKLEKVMRSNNSQITTINQDLIKLQSYFKLATAEHITFINSFVAKFPYNLFDMNGLNNVDDSTTQRVKFLRHTSEMYDLYMKTWKEDKANDLIILTYSKKNCDKTNIEVQNRVNLHHKRQLIDSKITDNFLFNIGDKCCIDRPAEEHKYKFVNENDVDIVVAGELTNATLYNGEIFDVLDTQTIRVKTIINNETIPYFDGQLLTVRRSYDSFDNCVVYKLVNLDTAQVEKAKQNVRHKNKRPRYLEIMNDFYKIYPKVSFGYCLTVYKSQGSEWSNVFINLSSIYWSLTSDGFSKNSKKKSPIETIETLYKTVYTAVSRASQNVYLYWPQ
jgi:hypothetical protein